MARVEIRIESTSPTSGKTLVVLPIKDGTLLVQTHDDTAGTTVPQSATHLDEDEVAALHAYTGWWLGSRGRRV